MKVLVIGGGGREHAMCWKLAQSPELEKLYCAPGNPGISRVAESVPIRIDEVQRLGEFADENQIDLTIAGPELPLVLGLAEEFAERELALFGPSARAAELEGSKVFAKEFAREAFSLDSRLRLTLKPLFFNTVDKIDIFKREFGGEKIILIPDPDSVILRIYLRNVCRFS